MKKVLLLILAIVLVAAGWSYWAPRAAAKQLQAVAVAGDTTAIRELVDFDALRGNLRGSLEEALRRDPKPADTPNGTYEMVGGSIDALMRRVDSPRSITYLFTHAGSRPSVAASHPTIETFSRSWDMNTFAVTIHAVGAPAKDTVVALLTRQGLKWRMTDVFLPDVDRE